MNAPAWLDKKLVLVLHDELLALFGGSAGLREDGLLEAALSHPVQLFTRSSKLSIFDVAAAYTVAITKTRPFTDGNKRAAFMATYIFLHRNCWQLTAREADATAATLELAGGEITPAEFASWLKENCRELTG